MRLVNPSRGWGRIATAGDGRLFATSDEDPTRWELRLVRQGREYSTRGPLDPEQVRALAAGVVGPEPWAWAWSSWISTGVLRLRPHERPRPHALAELAAEILRATSADLERLHRADRFEIWLCDARTGRPMALGALAHDREAAMALPHVRAWQCVEPHRQTAETWAFQDEVNARMNRARSEGRFRFGLAVFERTGRGFVRHGPQGPTGRVRPGVVPSGLLAEPFESRRLAILDRMGEPRPAVASREGLVPMLGRIAPATPEPARFAATG
jgi:hypothetical protein